jgi:hypothetical protein
VVDCEIQSQDRERCDVNCENPVEWRAVHGCLLW